MPWATAVALLFSVPTGLLLHLHLVGIVLLWSIAFTLGYGLCLEQMLALCLRSHALDYCTSPGLVLFHRAHAFAHSWLNFRLHKHIAHRKDTIDTMETYSRTSMNT